MSGSFDGWSLTRLDAKRDFSGNYDYHERFDIAQESASGMKENIG